MDIDAVAGLGLAGAPPLAAGIVGLIKPMILAAARGRRGWILKNGVAVWPPTTFIVCFLLAGLMWSGGIIEFENAAAFILATIGIGLGATGARELFERSPVGSGEQTP